MCLAALTGQPAAYGSSKQTRERTHVRRSSGKQAFHADASASESLGTLDRAGQDPGSLTFATTLVVIWVSSSSSGLRREFLLLPTGAPSGPILLWGCFISPLWSFVEWSRHDKVVKVIKTKPPIVALSGLLEKNLQSLYFHEKDRESSEELGAVTGAALLSVLGLCVPGFKVETTE